MDSGNIMAGNEGDEGFRDKQRWTESKVYKRKSFKGLKDNNDVITQSHSEVVGSEVANSSQQRVVSRFDAASDDSSSQVARMGTRGPAASGNGDGKFGFRRQENRVTIHLSSRSKQEMREIRRKLESELDLVRKLVRKLEEKEDSVHGGDVIENSGVRRVPLEGASLGTGESRPLHQLSISVLENSQGMGETLDKEKRTPKANQFYRKSDFLLAKDKIPQADINKKSKSNGKRQGGAELGSGKFSNKLLKSCSALLDKLMKHKLGWVFNKPVDAQALGLHDYFDIIKHPMDLGTVKSCLDKNWYKSPREFAKDVRLTFDNAMTYNPKGQDVYVMAELLSKMFEDKWTVIEADCMKELRVAADYGVALPIPTSKKAPQRLLPPPEIRRLLDRPESMAHSVAPKPKPVNLPHLGRTPAPKKPKARDPNKREMMYDEKQKLSTSLQSLPSEKLDNVVQIIKKRNPSLSQHDDEIEVDIDTFDTETLWELDRFVTNYKKSLSKNKRKVELGDQERPEVEQERPEVELGQPEVGRPEVELGQPEVGRPEIELGRPEVVQNIQDKNPGPLLVEAREETKTDGKNNTTASPAQVEKKVVHADRSSGSSSNSGSSSSESGSGSSSG